MDRFPLSGHLHTQVLQRRYGPVHAEVRRHGGDLRESLMVDGRGVPRTYCITLLARPLPPGARAANDVIRRGGLIGETFQEHGHEVRKNVLDVFVVVLPPWLRRIFKGGAHALARAAEFHARKPGAEPFIYGVVTEIYSQDFRPPLLLDFDIAQLSARTVELLRQGFRKAEIWGRLGRDNDWSDARDRHGRARVASLPFVMEHRKHIARLLSRPRSRADFVRRTAAPRGVSEDLECP